MTGRSESRAGDPRRRKLAFHLLAALCGRQATGYSQPGGISMFSYRPNYSLEHNQELRRRFKADDYIWQWGLNDIAQNPPAMQAEWLISNNMGCILLLPPLDPVKGRARHSVRAAANRENHAICLFFDIRAAHGVTRPTCPKPARRIARPPGGNCSRPH